MSNRDKPQAVIIPMAVFARTLTARVERVKREQAEIARMAYVQSPEGNR
jgi:hypothetical protein